MKKHFSFALISVAVVSILVFTVSFFSYKYISNINIKENDAEIVATSEVTKETKITKTETEDYYIYEVIDYERGLTYSWEFLKDDSNISVEDSLYINEDLRLSLNSTSNDALRIDDLVDQKKLIISFDYHGTLPLKTTVTIDVSNEFADGESLYLYYYNPEDDTIEYIMKDVYVTNGKVSFEIDHCSDYFLTGAVVNEAVNNPESINYIIIILVVVVIVLIAITLVQSKNKK